MNIVLLGAPGAGKGTQGDRIALKYNCVRLSTGDMFRSILADKSHKLYDKVKIINEGKLVPDETVNDVMEDTLTANKGKSFIFDGYPRTLAQADALSKILSQMDDKIDLVIDLKVSKEVLMYRLLGRRVCKKCKATFHVSQGYDVCPDCGGELYVRSDDNEQTVLKRFEEYKNNTFPLIEYYKGQGVPYFEFTAENKDMTPDDVFGIITDKLDKFFNK
ncbi:MAG: nucleoside monophosphate kinase [Clostridiales bacterium]|nr:nucleoside monophosphate kinase [Clostridiales bacterium]